MFFALVAMIVGLFFPSPATLFVCALFAIASVFVVFASRESTDSLAHQQALKENQLLLESLEHSPMPFCIYDESDYLVAWNEHYQKIYSRVFDALDSPADAKKLRYEDLVRANAEGDRTPEELEAYVAERARMQRTPGGKTNDRFYPKFGWYRVSKHDMPSGGVAGFAIDISELKQREADLLREISVREKLETEIRILANTDELTGISNRRHFIEIAEDEHQQFQDSGTALSVLMIDIDHFKDINDSFGHALGDTVISTVASLISDLMVDEESFLGRLGGEEFAVLLRETEHEEATIMAERIRSAVENFPFVFDGKQMVTTVSIGVASTSDKTLSLAALMKSADDALYTSKHNGRNCVSVSGEALSVGNRKAS